jgi:DGQHR domain-containing protein
MTHFPALKLSQFGIHFYQASLSAEKIEKLVQFEVISSGGGETNKKRRSSGKKVNWELLEEKIRRSAEAFQRPIISKKIEELVDFYEQRRENRDLPAVPGAVLLISEKRLNFISKDGGVGVLQIPEEEGILRVLDGQHRLLALHALVRSSHHDVESLQVPAVIFDALQSPGAVEMFVTINTKHTRLKPDLILGLSGKKLYPDEKSAVAHDILMKLNKEGALEGEIKILGIGKGKVSEAPLAIEIVSVLNDMEALGSKAAQEFYAAAPKFFLTYFKQIAVIFEHSWNKRKFKLKSPPALRAFIRACPAVLSKMRQNQIDLLDGKGIGDLLAPWNERIGENRFEPEEFARWKERGGIVERLNQDLREALLD